MTIRLSRFALQIILILAAASVVAQTPSDSRSSSLCQAETLDEFFQCYGGEDAFSAHYVNAITAFLGAEDAISAGDYAEAQRLADAVWAAYPKGNNVWWNAISEVNGTNVGSPYAYYGLRMVEDIVRHNLDETLSDVEPVKTKMKVVLVGSSEGIQPTTMEELKNGTGTTVKNTLDESLPADDYRIVKQSLTFFLKYVNAITGGKMEIELDFIELEDVNLPVLVTSTEPHVAYHTIAPVWEAIDDEVEKETDWWWIVYPSHVPEGPAFDNEAFITGGMGLDNQGGPAFIIDDKWIVRKPAHLGDGLYTDIERRIYLPQWFQHEFYHHLYRAYPELLLEVNGHDWFDRTFWPDDFQGQFETDYYAESLHKRLQVDCTPLHFRLINSVSEQTKSEFLKLTIEDDIVGPYALDNITNEWHEAEIAKEGDQYFWINKAGVRWEVMPNIPEGRLDTGSDAVYQGQDYFIELLQDVDGKRIAGVAGVRFGGELYRKQFGLFAGDLPVEMAMGSYQRISSESDVQHGAIVKEEGAILWRDEVGNELSLIPNLAERAFETSIEENVESKNLDLIISELECGPLVLGFEYEGFPHLRGNLKDHNKAPIIVSPLDDLQLDENFGTMTIDLSSKFMDPEDDQLLFFATSPNEALISTTIEDYSLILVGGSIGKVPITVTALDENGSYVVDEFELTVGQVVSSTILDETLLHVYPNPSHDQVYVQANGVQLKEVSLYDVRGREIHHRSQRVGTNRWEVDMKDIPQGVVILEASTEHGSRIFYRLIKQ